MAASNGCIRIKSKVYKGAQNMVLFIVMRPTNEDTEVSLGPVMLQMDRKDERPGFCNVPFGIIVKNMVILFLGEKGSSFLRAI